jgi:hypothetical protein
MKHLITIIALAAAAAAQAQTVALDGLQLVAAPATVHAEGDTVTMLWHARDTNGATFDARLAVTGCAAGKGRIAIGGGSVAWTQLGALQTDVLARATCAAGGRLS